MKYKVILRPEAEADLNEAFQWYESRQVGVGADFLLCVEALLDSIQRNPRMYQEIYKNVRRCLLRRFPYGVFYVIYGSTISVLAVLHAIRDPRTWQTRSN